MEPLVPSLFSRRACPGVWLGRGEFLTVDLTHVARGVYTATLPPAEGQAIEYYVEATTADGTALRWPATAPEICHAVVVTAK